jgi:hypothetical protein
MSPTRALVRERTALLARLVYEALRVGERDGPPRADGDGTADSNSGTAAPFEMSSARAADIAAAADAAVSRTRISGLDGEAALARAFEAAASARGDVGVASASRRLSETDTSTPRPIVRDAAALVSLKRLAVAMAAEMHARGDLRAASSFPRGKAAAETPRSGRRREVGVDPRTARARAALRDATRAGARATYGDAFFSGVSDVSVSGGVSRAAETAAEALCDSDAVARRVLAAPSAEEAAAAAAAGGRARGERFVAASWGLGSPDSGGGYVVRPGDVLAYEVKWAEAAEVDADDPVMGVSPGDDGPASFDASSADADAETRGTPNADASRGCVFFQPRRIGIPKGFPGASIAEPSSRWTSRPTTARGSGTPTRWTSMVSGRTRPPT